MMHVLQAVAKWLSERFDQFSRHALDFVRWVIRAERTTTGRVNVIGVIFAGIVGVIRGELFTWQGLVLIGVLVISATLADRTPHSP